MRATFGRLAAVRSLLLLHASTGSSSSCPGDYAEQMESLCGAAKAASAGNCFVCLAQHSQFRGCAGAAFDSYCLGDGGGGPAPSFGSCKDAGHKFMDCRGAASCAVLVLETGQGEGYYRHATPSVHGLWPQSGHYGNSACVRPKSTATVAGFLPACYDNAEAQADLPHQQSFVQHEWEKHGVCSGAADEAAYFDNICRLARRGIELMDNTKPLQSIASALDGAGLPVYCIDSAESQIYLSACAVRNAATGALAWQLAPPQEFATVCDPATSENNPGPPPPPPPGGEGAGASVCEPDAHGPRCEDDNDCSAHRGCLRCAHSGFCTMQPLLRTLQ